MMNRFTRKTSLGYEADPHTNVFAIYNALGQYEDAEEAGLLVRLPCKVGDTLYRIYTTYEELETGVDELTYAPRVEAVVVEDICLSRSARYITVLTERLGWHIRYALSDVRKYLFSTAEEAEQALKETQE